MPSTIVDYESRDFRDFWESPAKRILHCAEERIIKELIPKDSDWFIDIGAGYGRLLPAYRGTARKVILIDYSLKHLQMAENLYPDPKVSLIAANAYYLPFRDCVFSAGICVRLLHHLDQPERFAEEVARIFAGGGKAVVTFVNKRSLLRLLRYGLASFRRDHSPVFAREIYGTHPAYFDRLFRLAGFRPEMHRGAGWLHQIAENAPSIERLMGRSSFWNGVFEQLDRMFNRGLGSLELALMQYVLLQKSQSSTAEPVRIDTLDQLLACPFCRAPNLRNTSGSYRCEACGREFPKIGRIVDFRRA